MWTCCGYLVVLCCVIGSSKTNGLVLLRMLDCLECCLICSSCKLGTLNYVYLDQKLIFLCISEELGLLMDWVIYFVYHYVDLLDHWKMSSWLFSSSLLVPTRMTTPFEGRFFIRGFQSVPPMQEVWGKQVFTSLHALHITQPTFTLGTTTTQATPKFRASRWSSVGCWKPWPLHLWAALLIDTTISYLLVSPRWPLTGIIYQLYAPDLGILSWTCINRSGRSWQAFYLSISIINRIHITKPGHK